MVARPGFEPGTRGFSILVPLWPTPRKDDRKRRRGGATVTDVCQREAGVVSPTAPRRARGIAVVPARSPLGARAPRRKRAELLRRAASPSCTPALAQDFTGELERVSVLSVPVAASFALGFYEVGRGIFTRFWKRVGAS